MNSHTNPIGDDVQANCEAGASAGNPGRAAYGVSHETMNALINEVHVIRAHVDVLNLGFLDARPTVQVPSQSVSFVLMELYDRLGRLEDTLGNIGLGVRS